MKVAVCEDTDWLLSEEAYSIYAPCMYHPTCEDYRTQMEGFLQGLLHLPSGYGKSIRVHSSFNDKGDSIWRWICADSSPVLWA